MAVRSPSPATRSIKRRWLALALAGCMASTHAVQAEDEIRLESPSVPAPSDDLFRRLIQDQPKPTLPPVEVQAPRESSRLVPAQPSDNVVSPSDGIPPTDGSVIQPANPMSLPAPAPSEFPPDNNVSPPPQYPPNRSNRATSSQSTAPTSSNIQSLSEQRFGGTLSDITGLNSGLRGESSVFDSTQLSTVINREDLDQRLASNMQRALQNEVGVLLQQTGNGQISPFIRGLTGQQILILVDGIRLNTNVLRAGPNQYASTIDPGTIERIEVIRGAESALWGSDAIGGVINVVTRSPDPLRGNYQSGYFQEILATADTSSYSRAGFAGWIGNAGITGGISYLNVNELDRGGGLGRQPATDYDQYAADLKIQRMVGTDHMVTLVMQHFEQQDLARSDRFLPFVRGPAPNGSIPIQRPSYFDPQQRDLFYFRLDGLAALENPFADAYSVTMSESRTKEGSVVDRYPSNAPNAVVNRREISEFDNWMYGTTMTASKRLSDCGKLTYGLDYYNEDIDSSRVRINNPLAVNAVGIPVAPQYPNDGEADRVGTFVSLATPLTERLTVTPAFRYENINVSGTPEFDVIGPLFFERTYQDWIANVGWNYKLTRRWSLVGGYYEGFRAPTIDDLTANKTSLQNNQAIPRVGNLEVRPEHSKTYEVGTKVDGEFFRMQVVEWWTDFDSYITREDIAGIEFLSNQPAYLNGTELYSQLMLDRHWSLYGNFAYTYGRLRSNDQPVARIPPTQGTLGLRWDSQSRRTYYDLYTWLVDRADRYNQFNLADVRFIPGGTPGYATLNLRAGHVFGQRHQHRLTVSLENITDKYYRVLGSGVDGAGFNAVAGYEFQQ